MNMKINAKRNTCSQRARLQKLVLSPEHVDERAAISSLEYTANCNLADYIGAYIGQLESVLERRKAVEGVTGEARGVKHS